MYDMQSCAFTLFVCEADLEVLMLLTGCQEASQTIDRMVYLLFQEAIRDTFHQKYFQNQRKNYFTLVKKCFRYPASESQSQSVCVLQVEWRFKFISRSDSEKYFRNWIKIF